ASSLDFPNRVTLLAPCPESSGHLSGTTWPGVVLADGTVAGQVTVGTILRQPFLRKASVGYWIGSVFQNEGHASRAVTQVLAVMAGELGLHRAEASTRLENLASQKALRRNGFRPYGVAREHILLDGAWRDGILWELILGS
ncbi:GNAT family N-acetyltransferase, partial [Micromonospora sp. LOL_023]|uniref:GNAT family N-acetyltransferase n=1 Tax=Micromonospora sp. LOL_023 TaxID=3345418 RepID=UPI003A87330A